MDRERIGKYRILGRIGLGTMGEVFRALDPALNREVALKTVSLRVAPDDESLQRFQREAQAAALLNHPNIVTVHDYGQEDGILYMAMELLEGEDLRDAIDNDRLGSLDQQLDVMEGVLDALDYAHARGVVHRDIKPANIHLGPSPSGRQVKIMDFGLARMNTSEMTQAGIVLGTPNYMSPEQALGDKVDGRSDVFSAGAVLYELATESTPSHDRPGWRLERGRWRARLGRTRPSWDQRSGRGSGAPGPAHGETPSAQRPASGPANPWRSRLAPQPPQGPAAASDEAGRPSHAGAYRPWAELLARTFAVDVLACPSCQGRTKLLGLVKNPAIISRTLAMVGEATEVPRRSPGRGPPYWKSRVLRLKVLGDEEDGAAQGTGPDEVVLGA